MNNEQRKQIEKALEIITEVKEREQEKLDNMYENFSETERYQMMEEKKDYLKEAEDALNNAIE